MIPAQVIEMFRRMKCSEAEKLSLWRVASLLLAREEIAEDVFEIWEEEGLAGFKVVNFAGGAVCVTPSEDGFCVCSPPVSGAGKEASARCRRRIFADPSEAADEIIREAWRAPSLE